MSLDSVLSYGSMQLINVSLTASAIGPLMLHELYPRYDGYASPERREKLIEDLFGSDQEAILKAGKVVGFDIQNFVVHLCHAIWVEENVDLSWSLKDYHVGQIDLLFDRIPFRPPQEDPFKNWANRSDWTTGGGCWASDYKPFARMVYKTFPVSMFLVKPGASQHETAVDMVSWLMRNFFHPETEWGWETFDHTNPAMPDFFEQRLSGCHGLAKLLTSLLRSVNIPAIEVHETYKLDEPAWSGHGVCYMPTLERWVHGDHLADIALTKDNAMLLMDRAAMDKWAFCTDLVYPQDGSAPYPEGYHSLVNHVRAHDRFGSVKLWRKKRDLYVKGGWPVTPAGVPFVRAKSDPGDLQKVQEMLPEYHVHQVGDEYCSRLTPIQDLDSLSASYVKIDFQKDNQGNVFIRLKNEGHFPVPTDDGKIEVREDGGPHAQYALSSLADQDYRKIGFETYIPIGITVTGKEPKKIAAYLSGLPAPWPKGRAYLNCTIKGNVNRSRGTRIYHTPQSRYYKRTRVDLDRGDRWFCTMEEAEAAGFRPRRQ